MVGLLPDRPQRGKSGLTNPERVAQDFEMLFNTHCRNVASIAPTFLNGPIGGDAHISCGRLAALGCKTIAKRCAAEAIGDIERRQCRDFLALLAEVTICP